MCMTCGKHNAENIWYLDEERHRIGLSRRKVDSPAYADLDWKMALSEEVGKTQSEEEAEGSQPAESQEESQEVSLEAENEPAQSPETEHEEEEKAEG